MSKSVQNTLSGRKGGNNTALGFLFKPVTVIALVLIGIFSFAALIALSGYADDLRKDKSGRPNPQSLSAVGYAGYVQLLKGLDYEVSLPANLAGSKRLWETRPLRIYTLSNSYQSETIKELPQDEAKLIVLPKWSIQSKREAPGWVDKPHKDQVIRSALLSKLLNEADIKIDILRTGTSQSGQDYALKFEALNIPNPEGRENEEGVTVFAATSFDNYAIDSKIERLQYFDLGRTELYPDIILTADNRPILIRLENTQTFILSDPDIINTQGISTQSRARLAVDMLDIIAAYEDLPDKSVAFDLSIHGLGGGRNIVKVMTQPPFLAATLCLLAAGGIIAWQAFSRFGDPSRIDPDFAQGPVSLAKSSAEFMAVSNRISHMAPDYAQLTRQHIIRNMGLVGLPQAQIDRAITARETQRGINPKFAQLRETATQDNQNLIEHARALSRWKEEMMS